MSVPVVTSPEVRDLIDEWYVTRAVRTGRGLSWLRDVEAAIAQIGDGPTGYPILFEQPAEPSVPRLREKLHRGEGGPLRLIFRLDGITVRVVEVRPATARPLTDAEVRRLARRS